MLQNLDLQPRISKVFLITKTIFLTVGQNNFGNKYQYLTKTIEIPAITFFLDSWVEVQENRNDPSKLKSTHFWPQFATLIADKFLSSKSCTLL